MSKPKLTKQGVRDLNNIPGKSQGRKVTLPPQPKYGCNHKYMQYTPDEEHEYCLECGHNGPVR